jgi:hypothetical protein
LLGALPSAGSAPTSFWDNRESLVAFAGDDIDHAVFYPEDDQYLIDRETTVKHFTVH